MIFVTVGAQMPFDRLVRTVDQWADARGIADRDLFMQIGDGGAPPAHGTWTRGGGAPPPPPPPHGTWTRRLDADAFRACLYHASVVVTHAGMGTILTALELGRPVIVMPRRGDLGETRNDHQVETCDQLREDRPDIRIARDDDELLEHLDALQRVRADAPVAAHATIELLDALRSFIATGEAAPDLPADAPPAEAPAPPVWRIGPDTDRRDGEQRRAA